MSVVQASSELLEDVYVHQAISPESTVLAVTGPNGTTELVTVGTDHMLYNVYPDPASESGWSQLDMKCPCAPATVAAALGPDERLTVAVVNGDDMSIWVVRSDSGSSRWGAWKQIKAGPDIAPIGRFFQIQLRTSDAGVQEFLLVYVQKQQDFEKRNRIWVGGAPVDRDTWHLRFGTNVAYSEHWPDVGPSMALGTTSAGTDLFVYSLESNQIQRWANIDANPETPEVALQLSGRSYINDLFTLAAPESFRLFAAGSFGPKGDGSIVEIVGGQSSTVIGTQGMTRGFGVWSVASGYHLFGLDRTGTLVHSRAADGAAPWSEFLPISAQVLHTALNAEPSGRMTVFLFQKTGALRSLTWAQRSPGNSLWDEGQIGVASTSSARMMTYATSVFILDEHNRGVANAPVNLWAAEDTLVQINGLIERIGPHDVLTTVANGSGQVKFQQVATIAGSIYVPDLMIQMLDGVAVTTIQPYLDARATLYKTSPTDLLNARSKSGFVLPDAQRTPAVVEALAPRLNACSSIGMAPPASILQWVVVDAVRPDIPSGFARFTPADGPLGSSVLQELADLWESIVSGVESVANFVIRQIKVSANNIVEWVHVAIQTAKGVFSVVLDVISQGLHAIAAAFDEFEAGLEGVLEWLGTLFDWEGIKALAAQIKTMILAAPGQLAALLKDPSTQARIATQFATMDGDINGAFNWLRSTFGVTDYGFQTQNAGYQNDEQLLVVAGKKLLSAAMWLVDKLLSVVPNISLRFPELQGPVWNTIMNLETAFSTAAGGVLATALTNLQTMLTDASVWTHPLSVGVSATIGLFESVAHGMITFIREMTDAMSNAFISLAESNALSDILNHPLRIPLIADILEFIGFEFGQLTVVELLSTVLAVPGFVVMKAMGIANGEPLAASKINWVLLGLASLVTGAFNVGAALTSGDTAQTLGTLGICTTLIGLLFSIGVVVTETTGAVIIALVVGLAYTLIRFGLGVRDSFHARTPSRSNIFVTFAGPMVAIGLAVNSAVYQSRNTTEPLVMAATYAALFPHLAKAVSLWQPRPLPVNIGLAVVNGAGYGAAAALSFYKAHIAPAEEQDRALMV